MCSHNNDILTILCATIQDKCYNKDLCNLSDLPGPATTDIHADTASVQALQDSV